MQALTFVELEEGKVKKSSLEAVTYASRMASHAAAIVFGAMDDGQANLIGSAGASRVLHVTDEKLAVPNIMAYTSAIAEAMDAYNVLVLAKSPSSDPIAARVAIRINASLATNVSELPSGDVVKTSIYTGKAFANTRLNGDKQVFSIKKNAVKIRENGDSTSVEAFFPIINDKDFKTKITSTEKTTGEVLLTEADIVVAGGRGLKGAENWGMIEGLAKTLGAATACSKPVSDMDWRPHHEHVGQTGIKVSPTLYIAVGISGAIQHLAGVNSSKIIVVINKDPEAPFFKAADYGIVGDAFEVVPKLTEAIKTQLG